MPVTRSLIWTSLVGLCATPGLAQVPPAPQSKEASTSLAAVSVSGAANAEQIRYRDLLAGVDAFGKYRHYAPNSTLSFYLGPVAALAGPPPIAMALQTDTNDFPVPMAADGKFALPVEKDVGTDDAYLVANRADGTVEVIPTVRSPGDTESSIRLGDLRLQCEVSWAIEKQNVPKAVRAFFFIGGRMCHSSKIAVNYFKAPHKLRKAVLSHADRHLDLRVLSDGRTYWPPLGDTSWPDDSVVTLTFAEVQK